MKFKGFRGPLGEPGKTGVTFASSVFDPKPRTSSGRLLSHLQRNQSRDELEQAEQELVNSPRFAELLHFLVSSCAEI